MNLNIGDAKLSVEFGYAQGTISLNSIKLAAPLEFDLDGLTLALPVATDILRFIPQDEQARIVDLISVIGYRQREESLTTADCES
jgi:hypothetical protein